MTGHCCLPACVARPLCFLSALATRSTILSHWPLVCCRLFALLCAARCRSLTEIAENCRSVYGAARAWGLGRDRPGCAVETVDRDYCFILSPALWVSHGDVTGPHPWISFFSAHPLPASAVRGGQLEGLIILHLKRKDKLLHHMQRTLLLVGPWTVVFRLQIYLFFTYLFFRFLFLFFNQVSSPASLIGKVMQCTACSQVSCFDHAVGHASQFVMSCTMFAWNCLGIVLLKNSSP